MPLSCHATRRLPRGYTAWHLWKAAQEDTCVPHPSFNTAQSDIFIDNLPGFPDGISSNGKDKFWLAMVTPRQALFDRLLPRPFLRKVVYRLPKFLQPAPQRYSFVLALNPQGQVVDNLQNGSSDCYAQIANVLEHNNNLYFGSIGEDTLGRFALR